MCNAFLSVAFFELCCELVTYFFGLSECWLFFCTYPRRIRRHSLTRTHSRTHSHELSASTQPAPSLRRKEEAVLAPFLCAPTQTPTHTCALTHLAHSGAAKIKLSWHKLLPTYLPAYLHAHIHAHTRTLFQPLAPLWSCRQHAPVSSHPLSHPSTHTPRHTHALLLLSCCRKEAVLLPHTRILAHLRTHTLNSCASHAEYSPTLTDAHSCS